MPKEPLQSKKQSSAPIDFQYVMDLFKNIQEDPQESVPGVVSPYWHKKKAGHYPMNFVLFDKTIGPITIRHDIIFSLMEEIKKEPAIFVLHARELLLYAIERGDRVIFEKVISVTKQMGLISNFLSQDQFVGKIVRQCLISTRLNDATRIKYLKVLILQHNDFYGYVGRNNDTLCQLAIFYGRIREAALLLCCRFETPDVVEATFNLYQAPGIVLRYLLGKLQLSQWLWQSFWDNLSPAEKHQALTHVTHEGITLLQWCAALKSKDNKLEWLLERFSDHPHLLIEQLPKAIQLDILGNDRQYHALLETALARICIPLPPSSPPPLIQIYSMSDGWYIPINLFPSPVSRPKP